MNKVTREEQLVNRIMINYGIAVIAYIVLYILSNKLNMRYSVVLPLAGVMLAAGVVCYIFHKKSGKTRNYGHMFIGFTVALLATQSSFLLWKLFGVEAFRMVYNIGIFPKLLNSHNAVIGISWLGVLYLLGMTVYNIILIQKEKNMKKTKKKGKK